MQYPGVEQDGTTQGEPLGQRGQAPARPVPPHRVWVDEPASFATDRVCRIHHSFHQHPLMQLPELAQLAQRLFPSGKCRFVAPGITPASEFRHVRAPHDGSGIEEVFRRIEEPGAWVALYNVEADPAYRAFLSEVQAAVRPLVAHEQPGIFNVGGFIFISAPPSVTPFHMDRENNFWLQVRGRKTIHVWDHTDRHIAPARDVEDFVLYGSLERIRLQDGFMPRSHEICAGPGDGVYFPATSPHMTRSDTEGACPGEGVSISIGTVFYSDVTRRHARVHQLNQLLRRLGASPRPPGLSPVIDSLKAPLGHLIGAARHRLRGNRTPPPGSY